MEIYDRKSCASEIWQASPNAPSFSPLSSGCLGEHEILDELNFLFNSSVCHVQVTQWERNALECFMSVGGSKSILRKKNDDKILTWAFLLRCEGNSTGILLLWPNLSSRLDAATKAANRLQGRHIVRCGPKHRCASIIYPFARRWCHGENWVFRR